MFAVVKNTAKLVGTIVLASFCLVQLGFGQSLNIKVEAGSLLIQIQNEVVKDQLDKQEITVSELIQVYLNAPDKKKAQPAILGEFTYANRIIKFTPLLSFQSGETYYVAYQKNEIYPIPIPNTTLVIPEVLTIYPSSDTLPVNQLKFYIHFTAPMSEGKAYEYVKLVKNQTDTLTFPFVRLEPELWNRDKTRLTLWLDPGRVKRDLNPNRELGAPLEIGWNYELIIEPSWESQQGQALKEDFVKKFFVGFEDRIKPKTKNWKIETPTKNTKNPLRIDFGEPMDQALASRIIEILDAEQKVLSGNISFLQKEQIWLFTPEQPWQVGDYQIRIGAELEDLAGNNLNRLFDVDLEQSSSQIADAQYYWLYFRVAE